MKIKYPLDVTIIPEPTCAQIAIDHGGYECTRKLDSVAGVGREHIKIPLDYYVYVLIRESDNCVFYVGCGRKKRMLSHRNKFPTKYAILSTHKLKREALLSESNVIREFGIHNLTNKNK